MKGICTELCIWQVFSCNEQAFQQARWKTTSLHNGRIKRGYAAGAPLKSMLANTLQLKYFYYLDANNPMDFTRRSQRP